MRKIYAQYNATKENSLSPEIRRQVFTQAWAGITGMAEILKLRCDTKMYFEGQNQKGEIVVEAFFTDEEALVLQRRFPESFKVLVYA